MDLMNMADLWEENQEFLKQRLGQCDSERFGARWVLMRQVLAPKFNHVSKVRISSGEVADLVEESRAFFREQGLPASCIMTTPATTPSDLGDRLYGMGYTTETNPVMIWNGRPIEDVNPRLRVVEAPRDQAGVVFGLIREVFFPESTDRQARWLRHGVDISYEIGARNYLAYFGDHLVGVGSLFCRGRMGGIYNMGTLSRFRGVGVATAIMATCLADARRMGCSHVGLTPTPMGRPLYERLGFEEVYEERYFVQSVAP